MALHPSYNRVKAIGAIASHQLWTIGAVARGCRTLFIKAPIAPIARPHTSHTEGPTSGSVAPFLSKNLDPTADVDLAFTPSD